MTAPSNFIPVPGSLEELTDISNTQVRDRVLQNVTGISDDTLALIRLMGWRYIGYRVQERTYIFVKSIGTHRVIVTVENLDPLAGDEAWRKAIGVTLDRVAAQYAKPITHWWSKSPFLKNNKGV